MQVKECTIGVHRGISLDILLITHEDTPADMLISIQFIDFTVENQLLQYQHNQYDNGINTISIDADVRDVNIVSVQSLVVANKSRTFSTLAQSQTSRRVTLEPIAH